MMGSASSSSPSSSDSDDDSSSYDASEGEGQKVTSTKQDAEAGDKTDFDLSQLFHHSSLREAASKVKDYIPESLLQKHHSYMLSWLEEKDHRHEETVSLSQFCEFLMARGVGRDECVEAFDQFDVDGEGFIEVASMLETFKSSSGANLTGELSYVVRTLQTCSLTPGIVDVYSTKREGIGQHGKRLIKYILRNRAPSTGLPFFYLDSFSNITSMRLIVLKKYLNQKQKETALKEFIQDEGGSVKVVTKCYKWLRVSSTHGSVQRLEDNDPSTYWQSNGHARSHWIRMRLKENVYLQQLSIKVAQSDQSYMPQEVVVLSGRSPTNLHTIREVSIPSSVTGDVTLLDNAHVTGPYVQINIVRCHSDGCDVRVHGIRTMGYRSLGDSEVSVQDASIMWYFNLVASTSTVALATNPQLKQMILQHTRTALSHMPPLSLASTKLGRNPFPSPLVLNQAEEFLTSVARNADGALDMEGIKILLELSLARGIVVQVIKALQHILDSKEDSVAAVKLLKSLSVASDKITRKYAYLSEKTKVNMFFVSEAPVYVSKVQIKVSKGGIGPAAGFIFVYDDEEAFELERHLAKFEAYDTWTPTEYRILNGLRSVSVAGKPENPVAFFTFNNDWDEADVQLDQITLGRYILVKFLRPRDPANAERLGILGIRFFGHVTSSTSVGNTFKSLILPLPFDLEASVPAADLCVRVLHFIVGTAMCQEQSKKSESSNGKTLGLDMQAVSLDLLSKFYHSMPTKSPQWMLARILTLKLLHSSYPHIMSKLESETAKLKQKKVLTEALPTGEGAVAMLLKETSKPEWLVQWEDCSHAMFTHLCDLVNQETPAHGPEALLQDAAREAILDGAAVFFPDKEKRKKELFHLMDLLSSNVEPATNLVFQSLCHHFGSVDTRGLLTLPSDPTEENFDIQAIFSVFGTLQSVIFKEFESSLSNPADLPNGQSYVSKLLGALLASLMAWCKDLLQAKTPNPMHIKIAHDAILKYTSMQCAKSVSALNLLHEHLAQWQDELRQLEKEIAVKGEVKLETVLKKDEEEMQTGDGEEKPEQEGEQLQQQPSEDSATDDRTKEQQEQQKVLDDKEKTEVELPEAAATDSVEQQQQQRQPEALTDVDSKAMKAETRHEDVEQPAPSAEDSALSVKGAAAEQHLEQQQEQTQQQQQQKNQEGSEPPEPSGENAVQETATELELQQQEPARKLGLEEELQILVGQRHQRLELQQLQQRLLELKQQRQKLIDALQHSFVGTTMRQLTLMLILLSDNGLPQTILDDIMQVSAAVKQLQELLGCDFNESLIDDAKEDTSKKEKEKVVLRKWEVESAHKYAHNQHSIQVFNCLGAQVFQVDFDPRCETELRYDYLEFTDSFGKKTVYDQKVGTDKWPLSITFKSPHRLQFLFHSDSSNNEWGYKFTVTALGSRDIQFSWLYDLQLSLAKLQGKICSSFLNPPKPKSAAKPASPSDDQEQNLKAAAEKLLKGELWTTLFRGGHEVARLTRSFSGIHTTEPTESVINDFLEGVANNSPGAPAVFITKCQSLYHMPSVGGELINSAVTSVFAALLWHSQELRDTIPSYVELDSPSKPSDGILQAFRTAEGLRPLLFVLRQEQLDAQEKDPKAVSLDVEPIAVVREKARFLLQFAGLTKLQKKVELQKRRSDLYTRSKSLDNRSMKERQLSSEMNAAFQGTAEEGTVLSQYPEFKLVLDFVKNPHLTVERVRRLLEERQERARAVADVYQFACRFLKASGKPSIFQSDCLQFLKEMLLSKSTPEMHYASGLDGCGLELEARLRGSYYLLVQSLVEAVENFDCTDQSEEVETGYACMEACLLHLLDVNWQPYDLKFLCDIKAPSMLLTIAKRNVSVQDSFPSTADEAKQLEVHKQCMAWFKEFETSSGNRFSRWFSNIQNQESLEMRRAMQMLVARYCDLLPSMSMICDGCGVTLRGARYHCLECEAFDFCRTCFFGGVHVEGHRDDHPMVDFRYNCDNCHGFIVGTRIHCNICEDFDLCYPCHHAQDFPEGHTASHCVEVFPMKTVTSGMQLSNLLETYSHHHAWLLFSSLGLSLANMMHTTQSRVVNLEYTTTASKLFQQCIELATQCLPSAAKSHPELEGKKAETEAEETVDKDTEEKSPEIKEKKDPEAVEDKTKLREKAFTANSQAKVLGLLGAMLLETTRHDDSPLRRLQSHEFHIRTILPLLLKLAKEPNIDGNSSSQHQMVALLGQILLQILPREADQVLRKSVALTSPTGPGKSSVEAAGASQGTQDDDAAGVVKEKEAGDMKEEKLEGALTVDFLFELGAACLEKSGLEWTSLMASILQHLCLVPAWQAVLAHKITSTVQCLPQNCPLPCIFTLFVVAGFPEVLCLGSSVKYVETLGEQSNVIVMKHLLEKNRVVVTDVRTRKKKQVKDYKLVVDEELGRSLKPDQFSFFIAITKDLLTKLKDGGELGVETVWVLYLIMKAILTNLKTRAGPQFVRLGSDSSDGRLELLNSDLIPLLVQLARQATKLSRQWILRDLEILSIRLYTFGKSGPTAVLHSGLDLKTVVDGDQPVTPSDDDKDSHNGDVDSDDSDDESYSTFRSSSTDTSGSGYMTPDDIPSASHSPRRISESSISSQGGLDPLEGLDEKAKTFMNFTNDAFQTPLPILRAIYEKCGNSLDAMEAKIQEWFLEEGAPGVSNEVKELAKRWEHKNTSDKPSRLDLKSVDSGVVSFSASSSLPKPAVTPNEAEPEPCMDGSLKLIASSEKSLREYHHKQQRSKSAALLKKELNTLDKSPSREHLHKINYAISIMYARHLLAALLADWPSGRVINTSTLGCTEPAQIVSMLDLLQRGEEKEVLNKVVSNIVTYCEPELLAPLTVAACTFMEEASMAPVIRESLHKYKNNTNDEDNVTIRGATYLCIRFDERCSTESECDILTFASDPNFKHDKHEFSGGKENWNDFEMQGDVLYYKFVSDSSNNDWGYKFTVIGNRLGRFDTGYLILNTVLSKQDLTRHIALRELWAWLVHVACRQTAQYRLKTVQILLQVLHTLTSAHLVSESATIDVATAPDLGLLKPLLRLLDTMNEKLVPDAVSTTLPPLQRALTELFMRAENLALDWGIQEEYALAMLDEKSVLAAIAQGIRNVASLGIAIGLPNKATKEWQQLKPSSKTDQV